MGPAMHLFVAVLLAQLAQADVPPTPPDGQRFVASSVRVDGIGSFPGYVVLAWDAPSEGEVLGVSAFTATEPEQQVANGRSNRWVGLVNPRLYLLPEAKYAAWKEATGKLVEAQRTACSERNEGCVHISRFQPHYPPPEGAVDCGVDAKVVTSGPQEGPETYLAKFTLTKASDTECVLTAAPEPAGKGGCSQIGAGASLLALLPLLAAWRRRRTVSA